MKKKTLEQLITKIYANNIGWVFKQLILLHYFDRLTLFSARATVDLRYIPITRCKIVDQKLCCTSFPTYTGGRLLRKSKFGNNKDCGAFEAWKLTVLEVLLYLHDVGVVGHAFEVGEPLGCEHGELAVEVLLWDVDRPARDVVIVVDAGVVVVQHCKGAVAEDQLCHAILSLWCKKLQISKTLPKKGFIVGKYCTSGNDST